MSRREPRPVDGFHVPQVGTLEISEVRFTVASTGDGLLGFVSFVLNGALQLDGVAVRHTLDGRRVLSFPARRDRLGREHPIVRPLDDHARREIERQVFAALHLTEGMHG